MQRNPALPQSRYPYKLQPLFEDTMELQAKWQKFIVEGEKKALEEQNRLDILAGEYNRKVSEGIYVDPQMWQKLDREYQQNNAKLLALPLDKKSRAYVINTCIDNLIGFWNEMRYDFECGDLSEERLIRYLALYQVCMERGHDHPGYKSEGFKEIKREIEKHKDTQIFKEAVAEINSNCKARVPKKAA